jgi:D-3-phosphoglycerate dehydrogenase
MLMELISKACVGINNIDEVTATRKGILVMNTQGGNTISTSENKLAIMFAVSRKSPQENISPHQKINYFNKRHHR